MNFEAYQTYFEGIVRQTEPAAPYDKPAYQEYAKLNWARHSRWMKTGKLSNEITAVMAQLSSPQHWIIITEPWCGDAAHTVPFLHKISTLSPLVTVEYELRDSEPFRIQSYLTNGGKSIPKLIIRDADGNDLATWGPRPADCQVIYSRLMEEKADFETVKTELQKWYNKDAGRGVQEELVAILSPLVPVSVV